MSNTDSENKEPIRANPNKAKDDPIRAKCRIANVDPNAVISNTDSDAPRREKLRTDNEDAH
jgi:hypothetical protein